MIAGCAPQSPIMDIMRTFWAKVESGSNDTCWLWRGATSNGYGSFRVPGVGTRGAHRVAYELLVGPIPEGLTLDHLCRVRNCVNPRHLEPVTLGENVLRGQNPAARNARRARCKRGHEFTPENTMSHRNRGKGGRRCKACNRIDQQNWRDRQHSALEATA